MRTGFGRHREETKTTTEKIVETIQEEIPKAKVVVIEEKKEEKPIAEKKTVERKPVKKKIVLPSTTPVSQAEETKKSIGVAINGNTTEVRTFRAICKQKGWVIQDILVKFLKEFNEKNYTF